MYIHTHAVRDYVCSDSDLSAIMCMVMNSKAFKNLPVRGIRNSRLYNDKPYKL